jgi:hypothetical protein
LEFGQNQAWNIASGTAMGTKLGAHTDHLTAILTGDEHDIARLIGFG